MLVMEVLDIDEKLNQKIASVSLMLRLIGNLNCQNYMGKLKDKQKRENYIVR